MEELRHEVGRRLGGEFISQTALDALALLDDIHGRCESAYISDVMSDDDRWYFSVCQMQSQVCSK